MGQAQAWGILTITPLITPIKIVLGFIRRTPWYYQKKGGPLDYLPDVLGYAFI